jgi:adenosine/AMP kinase
MAEIKLELVDLNNNSEHNVVIGMSHFIKTVEDVHELMVTSVPGAKFGLAFCEASGPRLIRTTGTDTTLTNEALRMAKLVGAGHSIVLVMQDMYPINILTRLRQMPELVTIFCATANPVQVVVAESKQGRGIVGVIDGESPLGVETAEDVKNRQQFLRHIGYKM